MKNVPTDAVLRPQRGTDVMIVIDSNAYKDDDDFDYQVTNVYDIKNGESFMQNEQFQEH